MIQAFIEFVSALVQICVFTMIPLLFFTFRRDKSISFFKYIGLSKPTQKSIIYVMVASLLFVISGIGLILIDEDIRQAVLSPNSVTGKLRAMGLNGTTLVTLLVIALLKTSLSEELFFRGFVSKQLIHKFGFKIGNILQSAIFGFVHLLLFWLLTKTSLLPLIFILIFSSLAGWTIGYVKEKYANGSIIPGWIAHGLGNTLSYFIIAFVI